MDAWMYVCPVGSTLLLVFRENPYDFKDISWVGEGVGMWVVSTSFMNEIDNQQVDYSNFSSEKIETTNFITSLTAILKTRKRASAISALP